MKPVLYITNVAEGEVADPSGNEHVQAVKKYAAEENAEVIVVSAKMESEVAELRKKRLRNIWKWQAWRKPVWTPD